MPEIGFQYNPAYEPTQPLDQITKSSSLQESSVAAPPGLTEPPHTLNASLSETQAFQTTTPEKKQILDSDLRKEIPSRADTQSILYKVGKFLASHTITRFATQSAMKAMFLPMRALVKLNILDKSSVVSMLNHNFKMGITDGMPPIEIRSKKVDDSIDKL